MLGKGRASYSAHNISFANIALLEKHIRKILPELRPETKEVGEVLLAGRRIYDCLYRNAKIGQRKKKYEDPEG